MSTPARDALRESESHGSTRRQWLRGMGAIGALATNMNEFAAGVAGRNKLFGDAVNPWDTSRWPGGHRAARASRWRRGCAWAASGRTRACRSADRPAGSAWSAFARRTDA